MASDSVREVQRLNALNLPRVLPEQRIRDSQRDSQQNSDFHRKKKRQASAMTLKAIETSGFSSAQTTAANQEDVPKDRHFDITI